MKSIAIIPARSGSRRIPYKNIKHFCGQPIIGYTINAAKESALFDRIVVSTDDDKIAAVAAEFGAQCFRRSKTFATDEATMAEAVREVLKYYGSQTPGADNYRYACMLYACAPFITSARLQQGYDMLMAGYDAVFPVYEGPHVERAMFVRDNQICSMFPVNDDDNGLLWKQTFHHAGAWWWIDAVAFEFMAAQREKAGERPTLRLPKCPPFILPKIECMDIDTDDDWKEAEYRYVALHGQPPVRDEWSRRTQDGINGALAGMGRK